MSEEEFTTTLRRFTRQRPFIPFVVEMTDGRKIVIDQPSVAFGGGAAGFISESDELVDFSCDEVRHMAVLTAEVPLPLTVNPQGVSAVGSNEKLLPNITDRATIGGMSEQQFTDTLRELTKRKPFLPFVVELVDGRRIVVDYPSVAFSAGAAGFLNERGGLIRFSCDEVTKITMAEAESTA